MGAYRKWLHRDVEITQMVRSREENDDPLDLEDVRRLRRSNPIPEIPPDDDFKILDGRKTSNSVKVPCK